MICPNCGTSNNETYKFCMKCGSALPAQPPPPAVATQTPAPTTGVWQPAPPPAYQPPPVYQPSPIVPQPTYEPPRADVPTPPVQPQFSNPPQNQGYRPPAYDSQALYGQAQTFGVGFWRPFAGYGTRRRHVGWLMDKQGEKAQELSDKVKTKFNERSIPDAQVEQKPLTGRGVIVERRPYFLLQRGLVTVGLYVAQFGKDLFVSIASYLKPPISAARLILLGVMSLFALFFVIGFPSAVTNAIGNILGGFNLFGGGGGGGGGASLGSLLCVIGPLGTLNLLALFLFVAYSVYKFVTEKDILAGLRVQPNEFNEDDLMAVEKAVEQTVRISLDEIGLNSDELKPLTVEDGRRLI
jgi:hypothetical protein